MPVLDELATYLVAQGAVTAAETFRGVLPDTPDVAVALIETGGDATEHTMTGGAGSAKVEHPTVQVIARGAARDYETPRTKAKSVFDKLDGLSNTDLSAVRYFSIFAIQSPFLIARDENERVLIGFNVAIAKVPS